MAETTVTQEATTIFTKAQRLYQRNFNIRLLLPIQKVLTGSFLFVRKDYFTVQEKKYNLASVAYGPYEVMESNKDMVVLKILENTNESLTTDWSNLQYQAGK